MNIPQRHHANASETKNKSRWFITHKNLSPLIVAGWFIGCFLVLVLYFVTDITVWTVLKIFVLAAAILALIPYKKLVHYFVIDYYHMVVAALFGVAPMVTGLFLFLNFMFTQNTKVYELRITNYKRSEVPFENNSVILTYDRNSDSFPKKFKTFDYSSNIHELAINDSITLTISEGLFGYTVLSDYEFH